MIITVLCVLIVLLSVKAIADIREGRKKKKVSYWLGDFWRRYD